MPRQEGDREREHDEVVVEHVRRGEQAAGREAAALSSNAASLCHSQAILAARSAPARPESIGSMTWLPTSVRGEDGLHFRNRYRLVEQHGLGEQHRAANACKTIAAERSIVRGLAERSTATAISHDRDRVEAGQDQAIGAHTVRGQPAAGPQLLPERAPSLKRPIGMGKRCKAGGFNVSVRRAPNSISRPAPRAMGMSEMPHGRPCVAGELEFSGVESGKCVSAGAASSSGFRR